VESTQGKDYEMQFKNFLDRGKISELTSLLNNLGKKEKFNQNVKWIIIKFKGIVHLHIGNYQTAIKNLNSAIEYYKKADENFQCIDCILNRGEAYYFLGKYDLVLEEINRTQELLSKIPRKSVNSKILKAKLYQLKGRYFSVKGQFEDALTILIRSQNLYKELDNIFALAKTQNLIAGEYCGIGKYERARELLAMAVDNFMLLGNKKMLGKTLNNLGILETQSGDYDSSIQNFKLATQMTREAGDKYGYATTLINIGFTYLEIGEFEKARKYFKNGIKKEKKIGVQFAIAEAFNNLGDLERSEGNFKKAIKFYKKSINQFKSIKAGPAYFDSLSGLILTFLDKKDIKHVNEYINELENLFETYQTLKIKNSLKITKAYYYKHKNDPESSNTAKKLFKEVFEEKEVEFKKQVFCIINYCEITVKHYDINKNINDIDEIKNLTVELIKRANKAFSFRILAHSYMILGHIYSIQQSFEEAKECFIKAKLISEDKGLKLIKKSINLYFNNEPLDNYSNIQNLAITNLKKELSQMILINR